MAKKVRTFVRGLTSETYSLSGFRKQQLSEERVRDNTVITDDGSVGHSSANDQSKVWWRLGPGDENFLSQSIQVHFVSIDPQGANKGHGHQNEASFYIIDGAGYEIHDDVRYDWKKGDFVHVHTDSVHRHYNPYDEPALALVVKAKSTWLFMGLVQQGSGGPIAEPEKFGPREEWGKIWTPGVLDRVKVASDDNTFWELTPLGNVRVLAHPDRANDRVFSVDAYELEITSGSRSGKYWKMADEIFYVVEGEGHALMWEVEAEIAEKYYAHIALEPKRFDFKKGDTVYVPQNHVVQIFADGTEPLRLFEAQNRLFRALGYDNVHYFENAPEYDAAHTLAASLH